MPLVSNAGSFLLILVMTSSIFTVITTTTTVVVAASSVVSSVERRVSNNKSNKKQGSTNKHNDENETCTMEPFLGTSQYTNCAGKWTEVNIACATTTPIKKSCSYSEQPVLFQDRVAAAAATAAGCGDYGSFDPETHLTRDHATGLCRLKFLRLTSTCVGAYARSSGFGVRVEVPQNTGAAKGPLNDHKHHEDKNHKDNSGMFLRFSTNDGATYYNTEDPSRTIPLDRSSSRRMFLGWGTPDPGDCTPALG